MVHVKPKRPLSPVPHLQATIDEVLNAPDEPALTKTLEHFDAPHRFERPDERNLIHWYKLLNYFDQVLERYVTDRDILAKSHKSPSDSSQSATRQHENSSPVPRAGSDDLTSTDSRSNLGQSSATPSLIPSTSPEDKATTARGKTTSKLPFSPSPYLILIVLRVTQRLIRNASHDTRYMYNSVEHLCALLADENSAIILLTLEILNMLLQRGPKHRSARTSPTPELTERLMELATGWGGRENGLGLLDCCSSNADHLVSADGRRLVFKYTKTSSSSRNEHGAEALSDRQRAAAHADSSSSRSVSSSALGLRVASCGPVPLSLSKNSVSVTQEDFPTLSTTGKTTTIQIEDVGHFKGDERWLLTEFANKNQVPRSRLFSLLCSLRRATRFCDGRDGRIEATIIRLYAVTTLFSIQANPLSLNDILTEEPEFLKDVVTLARAETKNGIADIPLSLRVIAIRCLTAMSCDRQTHSSVLNVTEVNLHHGALPTLLRTEISELLSSSSDTSDPNAEVDTSDGMKSDVHTGAKVGGESVLSDPKKTDGVSNLLAECNRTPPAAQRIHLTESLLGLVYSLAMAPRSDGATPLANSGVLGILIPLLKDRDVRHSRVVAKAIRAMQGIIDGSSQSVVRQLFRDQDGLSLVAERIAVEVGVEENDVSEPEQKQNDEAVETEALKRRGESRALYEQLGRRQMTPQEALDHQPPSSSATSRGQLPQSKWALLRSLLQLLLVALGSGGNDVRALVVESKLPKALRKIMAQPFTHGGSLFQSAATVTTDIAHAEPTATPDLVKAGITSTVLRSIEQGLPPCGEAVRCIPNLLAALCLAQSARDVIVSSRPLKQYLLRLATPFYTRALHGDIPIYIGSTLDELMRHVEALRPNGNDAMLEYLRMSAKFVNTETRGFQRVEISKPPESGEEMGDEKASKTKPRNSHSRENGNQVHPEGDGEIVSSDEALLDKMKLAVANNSCRLAGFVQGSAEHQEGIVNGGGLHEMINLRNAPALACPEASVRDGYMFSRHYPTPSMTVVSLWTAFRNLSARHGASVLQSLLTVIMDDAGIVLKLARDLDDIWLPEEENPIEETNGNADRERRSTVRSSLSRAVKKLRVDVVLLSGLCRGGPSSSAGAWENAGGSHVASVIATVERAARFHLAKVYTGLTIKASGDGDLNTARVTATGNPVMASLQPQLASELLGDVNKVIGLPLSKTKAFEEACKAYKVPPEGSESVRQDVKGLAWHLVTFAVATQRLYSTLARGLTFPPRRQSRGPARHAASAKCLAATMGRIFALHLKAAAPLWDETVKMMGKDHVVAAWDFVRGVLIEIKGALFDESRRTTQSLILKYFLEAGGAEALKLAIRPVELIRALSMTPAALKEDALGAPKDQDMGQKFDAILNGKALSIACSLLATSDAVARFPLAGRFDGSRPSDSKADRDDDTTMSSDSISNQVHAIARIAVSDSAFTEEHASSSVEQFRNLVADKKFIVALREQTVSMSQSLLSHCFDRSVRRVALDVWNTCCSFLQLLGSCPGLGTSHRPPYGSMRLHTPNHEWSPEDIQRSALSVSMNLMTGVTEQPEQLLAAYRPEFPAMMDILGVIHSASQVYSELEKTTQNEEAEEPDDSNQESEPQQEQPSIDPPSVDSDMVTSLTEMGFPEERARRALRRTGSRGIESAINLLVSNEEESSSEEPTDEEPEDSQSGERSIVESPTNEEEEDEAENMMNEGDATDDSAEGSVPRESDGESDRASDEASEEHTPSSNAADDQVMIDAADTEDGTNQQTEENPQATSNESEEQSGPPSSQKADGEESGEEKTRCSSKIVTTVSLEQSGKELLDHSVVMELNSLSSALKASNEVTSEEATQLRQIAAKRMSAPEAQTKVTEDPERSFSTKPVSVAVFKEMKIKFFSTLLRLTREVIENAKGHVHAVHLPYIAIELLSVLQRDGSLREEESASFASLLTKGLELALSKLGNDNQEATGHTQSSSVALWAHYGGYRSRKALRESGAFRLAFEALRRSIDEWDHSVSAARLLDSEGNHPIKKLSINEKQSECANDIACDINLSPRTQRQPSVVRSIRSPTEEQAALLKRVTTCVLLLDADIRYQRKDQIILQSRKAFLSQQKGESTNPRKDQTTKMETDDLQTDGPAPSTDDAQSRGEAPAENSGPDDDRAFVQNLVDEHMRETYASGAISMDIDDKVSDGEKVDATKVREQRPDVSQEDVTAAKAVALKKKSEATVSAKKAINELMGTAITKPSEEAVSREALVSHCLCILKQWKTMEVGDAILAVLQLLSSLTKEWELARFAHEANVVEVLLEMPQLDRRNVTSTDPGAVRFLTKTILRHIIEDPITLQEAMEAEIRALTKSRPSFTTKSLIAATAPMAARDLQIFTAAMANTVKGCGESRGSHLQLQVPKDSAQNSNEVVDSRENVKDVVFGLSRLLVKRDSRKGILHKSTLSKMQYRGLPLFALDCLAEIVEVSHAAAMAFMRTPSPSSAVSGYAMDYVVQVMLPQTRIASGHRPLLLVPTGDVEEPASSVRKLFLALCSVCGDAQDEAVLALARAAELEAAKERISPSLISGIAHCIAPGMRLKVLRAILKSRLANDLARSLAKLDMSSEANSEVASSVLRALALIGQAASHIARHSELGDDTPFGSSDRNNWFSLRDRDDGLPASARYMVL